MPMNHRAYQLPHILEIARVSSCPSLTIKIDVGKTAREVTLPNEGIQEILDFIFVKEVSYSCAEQPASYLSRRHS